MPCAVKNIGFGNVIPAPLVAKIMAVIMGPSSNAAGNRKHSNITTKMNDTMSNTVSRHGVVQREGVVQRDKKDEAMCINQKIVVFNGAKHTLNMLALLASLVMLTIL
jgi:hypothetical protein